MADSASSLVQLDPVEAWQPWQPGAGNPWNRKWAGHLYRRAAFAGTWSELETAVRDGLDRTLDHLFSGGPGRADFDQLMDAVGPESPTGFRGDGAAAEGAALQEWWLYRLQHTPFPLQERMTLFWHNHFATSIAKVRGAALMKRQNLLLRRHALGKLGPLVQEISRDPAMLVWLDSNSNVKGKPNENYARELMELFTLGVGNYSEKDIREAARAFTGWHTSAGQFPTNSQASFAFRALEHDDGPKTVLGQTGNWDGGDVVRICLAQPACARFLVRKLYRQFVSESELPPDRLLEPLAERFRQSEYDIADLVRTMLRSRLFFSDFAYRQRVKSPVDFVIGLRRSLEAKAPGEGTAASLAGELDGLGQILFAPPSVKGWDGGRTWLNTATLLGRHNLAWRLVQDPRPARIDPAALARRHSASPDAAAQVDFLLNLLLQPGPDEIDAPTRSKLAAFLAEGRPQGIALERRLRETTHAVLVMPLYQLA